MCINARASNNPNAYVPFRDSKLTRLLQESLGGNAKTSLVVCVPDAVEHIEETMSSLQFGQRAMAVLMRPRVNEVMDPDQFTAELEERISRAETARWGGGGGGGGRRGTLAARIARAAVVSGCPSGPLRVPRPACREMLKAALFSKQEQLEALRAAMESDHFTQRQKLRDVAVRFKEQKAALQAEQAKRAELESTCQVRCWPRHSSRIDVRSHLPGRCLFLTSNPPLSHRSAFSPRSGLSRLPSPSCKPSPPLWSRATRSCRV